MENQEENEQKPIQNEADLQKQIEEQKRAEEQRIKDEQQRAEEQKLKEQQEQAEKDKRSILDKTEELTPLQKAAKNPEDEALKIHLIGGGTTSIQEQKGLIAEHKQPYVPHFGYEKPYFKETFRIKQWKEDYRKFRKRKEMANVTTGLIYARFRKEVLPLLRAKNPFIGYLIRKYKLFQFLTPAAQIILDGFIDDFCAMILSYDNWDLFERDYCIKYKLPYQQKLF